jgi:hypothetical protein
MAFAGIFQPFARLRWIRFGLLMRDRKFSRRFSVPQTELYAPSPVPSYPKSHRDLSDSSVKPIDLPVAWTIGI